METSPWPHLDRRQERGIVWGGRDRFLLEVLANFVELRYGEVRRTHLLRGWVNTTRGSAPFGALPESAHGRCRARVENRDVPVIRVQSQFCRRAMARQPLAVRGGHDPIPASVQEKSWSGDVGGVEAPRPDSGEIIVDEPSHAASEGAMDHVDEPRPLAGESGFVFGSELRLVV